MFKRLNNTELKSNVFISPISVSIALSMLYAGAETTTKDELSNMMGYMGIDKETLFNNYSEYIKVISKESDGVKLSMANSLWLNKGLNFVPREDYVNLNKEIFNAEVQNLDFSLPDTLSTINKWIEDKTNNKIKDALQDPIDKNVMLLINTIYFKGDWLYPFDPDDTKEDVFTSGEGEANKVDMMFKYVPFTNVPMSEDEINYLTDDELKLLAGSMGTTVDYLTGNTKRIEYSKTLDYEAIALPYKGDSNSMYIILPGNKDVNKYIEEFSMEKFSQIKSNMKPEGHFDIYMPKFKMEYGTVSFKDVLKSLGMVESFNAGADFSGIRPGIWVDDVLHKAFIEVNEVGTEAAAATVVKMIESMPMSFRADRPFLYIITDDTTGSILFIGKAYDLGIVKK